MEKRFIIHDNTNRISINEDTYKIATFTESDAKQHTKFLNKQAERQGWKERYYFAEVDL